MAGGDGRGPGVGRLLVGIALEAGLGAGQEQLVDARCRCVPPGVRCGDPAGPPPGRAGARSRGRRGRPAPASSPAPRSARPGWAASRVRPSGRPSSWPTQATTTRSGVKPTNQAFWPSGRQRGQGGDLPGDRARECRRPRPGSPRCPATRSTGTRSAARTSGTAPTDPPAVGTSVGTPGRPPPASVAYTLASSSGVTSRATASAGRADPGSGVITPARAASSRMFASPTCRASRGRWLSRASMNGRRSCSSVCWRDSSAAA